MKHITLEEWLVIFKAFEAYNKERELYAISNRIGCDSARYTGKLVNNTFKTLTVLLKQHNIEYKEAKEILYGHN